MRRTPLAAVVAVALLVALAACDEEGEPPSLSPTPTSQPAATQAETPITVTTDKREYRVGEPVVMTLVLANRSGQAITLEYRNSQRYDFRVADSDGRVVWRWSEDKLFAQVIGRERLEPGESLQFSETWDQTEARGEPLPPGDYLVEGTSPFCQTSGESACNTAWTEGPQIAIGAVS
ncbi:MAG: BsuPI-related putative proteinase inhibitor [Dehalococcoidia bacterium]